MRATAPKLPALLLGSHFDTVRNAGKWDGPLGVITAIACVADLNRRGKRLPFAIEVAAFADEEGVRFASTLLGSRAVAGTFDESVAVAARSRRHQHARGACRASASIREHIGAAARAPSEYLAYLELHIEQGPVLEAEGLPVGVVTAISGATRLLVTLEGMAGHAGTVPMAMRRDALAGAAECIVAIEQQCRNDIGLFGTVGIDPRRARRDQRHSRPLQPSPSTCAAPPTSIAGWRSRPPSATSSGSQRSAASRRRSTSRTNSRTVPCADWLQAQISAAIARQGYRTAGAAERRRPRRHGDRRPSPTSA